MKLGITYSKLFLDIRELVKSVGIGLLVFCYLRTTEEFLTAFLAGVAIVLVRSQDWI